MSGLVQIQLSTVGLPVDGSIPLDTEHSARLSGIVREELSRYPVSMVSNLPTVHLVETAEAGGKTIGARYFVDQHAVLLAARHDLRGNVHRVIARALMAKNEAAAVTLQQIVDLVGPEAQLYRGLLSGSSAAAALVGAVMHRRSTLDDACRQRPALQRAVTAARQFLSTVGIDDGHLRSLPPAPQYAYLSRVTGQGNRLTIQPGNVPLTIGPPPPGQYEDHHFEPVPDGEAPLAQRAIERSLWYLPEGVISSAVKELFVVADVQMSNGCDIAGFATGYTGQAATVVIEHRRGRRTTYHELGHALHFRHHDLFPAADWVNLVPADNGYFGSGQQYIEAGVSLRDYSAELLDRGFITGYSSASMEEDIAEIFEAMMVGEPRLAAALPDSKRVAGKVRLLAAFLRAIDPTFSDDFFSRLRHERAVQEAAWGAR